MLKQKESNVPSLKESNEGWGGVKLFLLSYKGHNSESRCGETNLMEIPTAESMESVLEKDQSTEIGRCPAFPSLQAGTSQFAKQQWSIKPTRGDRAPHKGCRNWDSEAETTASGRDAPGRRSARKTSGPVGKDASVVSWEVPIRDRNGLHEYITWAEIQQKESRGSASFQDEDFGKGLHAEVDRNFLKQLRNDYKLNADDYEVDDAAMYESKYQTEFHITVFVTLKNKKKLSWLKESRKSAEYEYEGPIPTCRGGFIAAGGKDEDFAPILKKDSQKCTSGT
ncbi:hypothetical protein PMIN04_010045 [Paraphaeosphaeria minitans]